MLLSLLLGNVYDYGDDDDDNDKNLISPNLHPFTVGCNFRGSQFKHGQTWQPYFPLLGVSKCITCSCRVSNIAF